jgi:hypothetical protein
MADVKFSDFTNGNELQNGDEVVGLRSSDNVRFDFPGVGIKDASGNYLFKYDTAGAASVNALKFFNSLTTLPVKIATEGSDTNRSIEIEPGGAGAVIIDGITYPTADGTNLQAITTNGSAVLGFSDVAIISSLPTTDNAIARFDGTGGALQDSGVLIDDSDNITGITSAVVGLMTLTSNSITTAANNNINVNPGGTGSVFLNGVEITSADKVLAGGGATLGSIDITSNDIISTSTNQDIQLTPNGTGTVIVGTDLDVDNINIDGNTISSTNTNGDINLTPNGTGQVTVTNSIDAASGITFDAGTNTLDKYVENTWTPNPFGSTVAGTPTGTFTGTYTRVGRVIFLTCSLTFTNLGGMTGNFRIDGFPVAIGSASNNASLAVSNRNNFTNDFPMTIRFQDATNILQFFDATQDNVQLAITDMSNTTVLNFSGFYFVGS